MRQRTLTLLQEEAELNEIVQLVGVDSLSSEDRMKLEDIRKAVESLTFQSESDDFKVTLSIGGKSGNALNIDLLKEADKLLYKAKEKRNIVVTG